MENTNDIHKDQTPVNEQYDTNHPEKQTVPAYNSATSKREGAELPAVENLNQPGTLDNTLEGSEKDDSVTSGAKNDESLFGEPVKTDLGAGQRDADEDESEKIIRT